MILMFHPASPLRLLPARKLQVTNTAAFCGGLGASVESDRQVPTTGVILTYSLAKAWAHCLLYSLLGTLQCGQCGHFRDCELEN